MNILSRLEILRKTQSLSWGELCELLKISRTMIHYVRVGDRQLSERAQWRLAEAERKAGIMTQETENHVGYSIIQVPTKMPLDSNTLARLEVIHKEQAKISGQLGKLNTRYRELVDETVRIFNAANNKITPKKPESNENKSEH